MADLTFDFPGLRIGVAEYDEGPTGCTVFRFDKSTACATDVRGGSPGYLGADYPVVDAIVLAGGSIYGLAAVDGVRAGFLAERSNSTQWDDIPLVGGAIIFDFRVRTNAIYPDAALGRRAFEAAVPGVFPLGPRGAGRSATVGKLFRWPDGREPCGQGAAFQQVRNTKIFVATVINAVGAIVDREGRIVRGHSQFLGKTHQEALAASLPAAPAEPGNTTLTVVVVNQKMGSMELRQLGRQVHASMARAIQPWHTATDGDVLFALTTSEVDDGSLPTPLLATIASEVAWDAVLASF